MSAFSALAGTLRQLADTTRPLATAEYTRREVCYDQRERETVVEHEAQLGVSRLQRAASRVASLDERTLSRTLTLRAQVNDQGLEVRVPTSVGRELAFVIRHTIHHSALIAVLLEGSELNVPSRLGMAPTTCAP